MLNNFENKNYWEEKLTELLKRPKWKSLVFTDFDDTLVSRIPQFLNDPRFIENRWEAWVKFVRNVLWIKNFLETYYSWDMVVQDILEKTDVILTAWERDLQEWKLKYTWINKENIIVEKHSLKVKAMLDYIVENIWYIPESITFIDDKAFKLEKEFQELSNILKTKIILQNIKLDQSYFTKKYTIHEKVFNSWEEFIFENGKNIRIFDENGN